MLQRPALLTPPHPGQDDEPTARYTFVEEGGRWPIATTFVDEGGRWPIATTFVEEGGRWPIATIVTKCSVTKEGHRAHF